LRCGRRRQCLRPNHSPRRKHEIPLLGRPAGRRQPGARPARPGALARPAFKERVQADRAAHDALRKAAIDPGADIRPLADAAGKAHAEVAVLRAETMRKVIPLLTPEQRTKLEQAPAGGRHHGRR
jgi:Spy/CpxP family protein refolding chaperone